MFHIFYDELKKVINPQFIKENEEICSYTTFKIGGTCDYLINVQDFESLINLLQLLKSTDTKYAILGNGSNVLFSDNHFYGVVIKTSSLNNITVDETFITAFCGAKLSVVCNIANENGLKGLELLNGIPGTVGGGVYMNAGAYGGEIKDTAYETTYVNDKLEVCKIVGAEHEFSYRHSFFSNKNYVILKTSFKLQRSNSEELKKTSLLCLQKRNEKQPLNFPNAGSTFKRPEGYFAGKLIEDCGLKNFHIGDAYVSEKHSGFVVNKGKATAKDVTMLIEHIKKTVFEKYGVMLQEEIKYYQ